MSGFISFSSDWDTTYSCSPDDESGSNSFKNTVCYAWGQSSRYDKREGKPRLAALAGSGLFETACNYTRDFIAELNGVIKKCSAYTFECLRDVDVVVQTSDPQSGSVYPLSPEEGDRLKDFAKCGGSLVVYHGHNAAQVTPDFAWQFAETFGVEMVDTGVCLSNQLDDTSFIIATKTSALPETLRSNPSCGGTVDEIRWKRNCHEQLRIVPNHTIGQHATAVYANDIGHVTCSGHCGGMKPTKERHLENVIIKPGALNRRV
jgi:hypothetical protein